MKIQNKIIRFLAFILFVFYTPYSWTKEAVVEVKIHGVDKEIEENIRASLTILHEDNEEIEAAKIKQIEMRAQQEISLALQPFGYYEANIQSHFYFEKTWIGEFTISLGLPVRVNAIHFQIVGEGQNDPQLKSLQQDFTLEKGDIFLHELYDQSKKAILSKSIQNGYLNASFIEHRVEVNPELHSSNIFLTLETGQRFYFGQVTFDTTVLSEKFLKRYLSFTPGDVYSPEKTLTLQSQLTQSDYFSQINVKPLVEENSNVVPVKVELEDAKPNQYLVGGGYGTDTGLRAKLGWTRRRLNENGHRLSAQAQISQIYHTIQMDYSIPGKHPQTDQIKLKAGYYEDEFTEKTSQIFESGILEERNIDDWQRRLSLNYHHEEFYAFDSDEKVISTLILPSVTFIQVKRDDHTNPTRGRRIEFTMRGSVDGLISDTSFFQTYLQIKWLHAFNDTTKALMRTELGFTVPDNSSQLPLSQRFFAGGDLSLRGYGYRSLPEEIDQNGILHPVGGAYLGIGSIELVKTLKKPVGVFTFFDAGNAFRQFGNEIAMGTGVGIEWQTRLGPIKFAIAKPLTKTSNSWRIHATFGPEL